jgi:hypothetical protein
MVEINMRSPLPRLWQSPEHLRPRPIWELPFDMLNRSCREGHFPLPRLLPLVETGRFIIDNLTLRHLLL